MFNGRSRSINMCGRSLSPKIWRQSIKDGGIWKGDNHESIQLHLTKNRAWLNWEWSIQYQESGGSWSAGHVVLYWFMGNNRIKMGDHGRFSSWHLSTRLYRMPQNWVHLSLTFTLMWVCAHTHTHTLTQTHTH